MQDGSTTTDTHKSEFSYKSSGTFPTDGVPLSGDAGSMTYARKILIPKVPERQHNGA